MIVGTAGHIDHGKTALVKALTGVDADRLAEEKARGITIDLGFAYRKLPSGETLGFVDVPGHERFIHNMLAGATGIDFVLLVVAADDGPRPQTVEHLAILDLLGVRRGVVALTKCDLAEGERRAAVGAQIEALLAPTTLAGIDIIEVSAVTGEGIERLAAKLADEVTRGGDRAAAGRFRLAVDRCFTLTGAGTVVTGTVFAGAVGTGDAVVVTPAGLEARVRDLRAQNAPTRRAVQGQRCALNLAGPGIGTDTIQRGDWITVAPGHAPTDRLDARLRLLPGEAKPLRHWTPVHLHLAAAHVPARVVLLEGEAIAPGGGGLVQLVLDRPIGALWGDRFVLRDTSAQRTLGGGQVLDPAPPQRRRRTPERLAALAAMAEREPEAALLRLLELPPGLADLDRFARDRNLTDGELEGLATRLSLLRLGGRFAVLPAAWTRFGSEVKAALAAFHAANPDQLGMAMDRLRAALPTRIPAVQFTVMLQALQKLGAVAVEGGRVRLPGHAV
ncbi:MAG: selenocysteine-specific translation elongation factor, partial [Geminicoccaceae bacterium]